MGDTDTNILTVKDYLINKVKFDVPAKALCSILADREMAADDNFKDADKDKLRLAYADILKWMCVGPSKKNNTSDTDNGWTHSSGGYQLSTDDLKDMKAIANSIYGELEPASSFGKKVTFRINSAGIMRANRSLDGSPLPHIIK